VNPEGSHWRADVAVLGRGPAGAAAALELARLGASVIVVDRGIKRSTLGESLPPGAATVLRKLCLWDEFLTGGHKPAYGNRSSWGTAAIEESDFIRSPHGNGWHIDRPHLDGMLQGALDRAGVRIIARTRALGCRQDSGGRWTLTLTNGETPRRLDADFLIDAGGRARQLVRMLGVGRRVYDRLIGAVSILTPEAEEPDHSAFTQIEAMPDGWWYASVLPDGRLAAGYMTDADGETGKLARTEKGWLSLLERTIHLRERVARYAHRLQGAIQCVAADSSRLEHVTGNRWCAAGDAAAAYDPLSSQGITSAMTAGMRAARAIGASDRGGLIDYEERMRHEYAHYLAQWLGYYALERRWENSTFWRRRHDALENLLATAETPTFAHVPIQQLLTE
jgi:flavin-dependent dehydrogenase